MKKKMKTVNLSRLLSPHKGKWVAINHSETRVVAAGDSVQSVVMEAQKKGEENPVVVRSPDRNSAYLL